MLMTDLAVRDLEGRRDSVLDHCRRLLVSIFGRESDHHLPNAVAHRKANPAGSMPRTQHAARQSLRVVRPASNAITTGTATYKPWQRHPQLRSQHHARPTVTATHRTSRIEAERGIILARGGKLDDAIEAFRTAASDPAVDLASLPGFWDLPRGSMITAVRAYEQVGRLRDASALEARIRHMLRPRSLKPVPSDDKASRITASGD